MNSRTTERVHTLVIGGGQAGLSVGYHLSKRGISFLILDTNAQIGDAWRQRWDSLRLFTPARFDGLDGMPFPAGERTFPTKDEMAAYLGAYAERFRLPVRSSTHVDGLFKEADRFVVTAGGQRFEAQHVVVAMSNYQHPRVPAFADDLSPDIMQLHSSEYRKPAQLRDGGVLIVGAGNSGAEIAADVATSHRVWLSGRSTGEMPFRMDGFFALRVLVPLLFRGLFHRLLTTMTSPGRRVRRRMMTRGGPLIRVKRRDLAHAGVELTPRTAGVRDGLPLLADGRALPVTNVIWCTGFDPGFDWIKLPVLGEQEPLHHRGIVADTPGLYFVGLHFLYALSSSMVHGVGRDAEHIANQIANRARIVDDPAALVAP